MIIVGLPEMPEGLVGDDGLVPLGGERVTCEVYREFLAMEEFGVKLSRNMGWTLPSEDEASRSEREKHFLESRRNAQKVVDEMEKDGLFRILTELRDY